MIVAQVWDNPAQPTQKHQVLIRAPQCVNPSLNFLLSTRGETGLKQQSPQAKPPHFHNVGEKNGGRYFIALQSNRSVPLDLHCVWWIHSREAIKMIKKNQNIPVGLSGRTWAGMESPYVWNHTEDGGFIIFMFILIGGTSGNDDSNDICWGRELSLCTDNRTMCCWSPVQAGASSQESSGSFKPQFPQLFPLKDKWEERLEWQMVPAEVGETFYNKNEKTETGESRTTS